MTFILKNTKDETYFYFDWEDEMITWIRDTIDKNKEDWEIIDEEGGVYVV